jgi:hypothetical protein
LNRLAKQFLSTIIAITAAVTSIVTQAPKANANEVRTITKNGISLNANPTYGYKHGAMKVSQYFTSNYVDNEQRWELIPSGFGSVILRNIALDKCFNSYQTQVGSTPNLYPCDTKDDDQRVRVNNDTITHVATGLQLNLGDRNDTPVVWKQTNINTKNNENKNQPRLILQQSGFGLDMLDLNPLSSEFLILNLGRDYKVRVNVSEPGSNGSIVFHTYAHFNKDEGSEFVYDIKKFKNASSALNGVGNFAAGTTLGAYLANKLNTILRKSGFIGSVASLSSLYYENMSQNTIDDAEYCINKGSGFWVDAKGGVLFLDQQVKCD